MYTGNTSGLTATNFFIMPKGSAFNAASNPYDVSVSVSGSTLIAGPLAEGDKFQVTQLLPNDGINSSAHFTFGKASIIEACDYVPAQTQIKTCQVLRAATEVGESFILNIIDVTEGSVPNKVETYTFTSITGSETVDQIAAGIVDNYTKTETVKAKRNVGVKSNYTLTVTGDTITITANSVKTRFEVTVSGDFYPANITETQSHIVGEGEGFLMGNIELERQTFLGSRLGDTDRFDNWNTLEKVIKPECSYDSIKLFMENFEQKSTSVGHIHHAPQVVFYFETDTPGTSGSQPYTDAKTMFGL